MLLQECGKGWRNTWNAYVFIQGKGKQGEATAETHLIRRFMGGLIDYAALHSKIT